MHYDITSTTLRMYLPAPPESGVATRQIDLPLRNIHRAMAISCRFSDGIRIDTHKHADVIGDGAFAMQRPGTHRVFLNVHDLRNAIVIEPMDPSCNELVIEVDHPEEAALAITRAAGMSRMPETRRCTEMPVTSMVAIIADDVDMLEFMGMALDESGYPAIVFGKSEGAWALIRDNQPALAVIVLQQELSGGDRTLAKLLKDHSETSHIPLLVGTREVTLWPGDANRFHESSVTRFRIPIDRTQFLALVESHVPVPQDMHTLVAADVQ